MAIAQTVNQYSNSSTTGDTILKSSVSNNLILQSGTGTSAITINQSNDILLNNTTTCLSSLNVSGIIFGLNIPKKSEFTIILSGSSTIGSTLYNRYDLDLTQYTKYITTCTFGHVLDMTAAAQH